MRAAFEIGVSDTTYRVEVVINATQGRTYRRDVERGLSRALNSYNVGRDA